MAAPIRFPCTIVRARREPITALGLRLPAGWQRADFYADFGAAYAIVSVQLALATGFDFKQGERASIQVGDGHCLPIYLHRLPLQVGVVSGRTLNRVVDTFRFATHPPPG